MCRNTNSRRRSHGGRYLQRRQVVSALVETVELAAGGSRAWKVEKLNPASGFLFFRPLELPPTLGHGFLQSSRAPHNKPFFAWLPFLLLVCCFWACPSVNFLQIRRPNNWIYTKNRTKAVAKTIVISQCFETRIALPTLPQRFYILAVIDTWRRLLYFQM